MISWAGNVGASSQCRRWVFLRWRSSFLVLLWGNQNGGALQIAAEGNYQQKKEIPKILMIRAACQNAPPNLVDGNRVEIATAIVCTEAATQRRRQNKAKAGRTRESSTSTKNRLVGPSELVSGDRGRADVRGLKGLLLGPASSVTLGQENSVNREKQKQEKKRC